MNFRHGFALTMYFKQMEETMNLKLPITDDANLSQLQIMYIPSR